jgi:lysozyme family protein
MDSVLFFKYCDLLDEYGYFKEAEAIERFLIKEAQVKNRRRRKSRLDYRKVLLVSLVTSMLATAGIQAGANVVRRMNSPQDNQIPLTKQPTTMPQALPQVQPTVELPKGDFEGFIDFLAKVEGGLSNRSKAFDPGGLTNLGITQKTYDAFRKEKGRTNQSVVKITEKEKNEIAKEKYWNVINADKLPKGVALILADWRFNGGKPIKALQEILKIPVTGKVDDVTLEAVWNFVGQDVKREQILSQKLISERQKYLESLRTKVKGKKVPLINYNRGWYNRLDALRNITIPTQEKKKN